MLMIAGGIILAIIILYAAAIVLGALAAIVQAIFS